MAGARQYPARWEADVVLRDGAPVHVRPIRPDDAPRIDALHRRLSAQTVYFRFFSPLSTLPPKMLERFVNVDYHDRMALVALLGDEVVAVARYDRLERPGGEGDDAEVAFLVDDAHQGRGLGTLLLEHLAVVAREEGIARFVADTLPENTRMLRVFREAGFGDERRFSDGVVRVVFSITPTEASLAATEERDRHAVARSVHRLLHPRSVAVVGANRRRGTVGRLLLDRLLRSEF
ncbi:MAG: GNAT family N-acetyltransferase, partial [Acidimicrobiaceae bacterium]|nr:GNAT family N-acetyltransferase [Acidimicrobiaceae bacterium]